MMQLLLKQKTLLDRARDRQQKRTNRISNKDDFLAFCQSPLKQELGWAMIDWCGDDEMEVKLAEQFGISIRCILPDAPQSSTCVYSGQQARQRVIFARSY